MSHREPAPASTRSADLRGARGTGPTSTRMEELAHLYRKIADMQGELAETEARLEKALHESAGADEMVGQMLARMGEVEGRLHGTQKQAAEANARAEGAESRASELAAQLGKARATQAELAERLRAAESRLSGDRRDFDRLRSELEAARTEATVAIAAAEEAQDNLLKERDQSITLRAELSREASTRQRDRDERETLRLRVSELALVCDERDKALLREEMLEADLEAARREVADTLARASSGEHRMGDAIADKAARIEELEGDLSDVRSRLGWSEKELLGARREIADTNEVLGDERALRERAEERAASAEQACERAKEIAEGSKRARAAVEEQLHEALLEMDAIAKARGEAERRAEDTAAASADAERAARDARGEAEREIGALRAELDGAREKLRAMDVERELQDGLEARTKSVHDNEIAALRASHTAEVDRLRASMDEASQTAARSHYELLTRGEQLALARRERDAAIAERDAAASASQSLEGDGRRLRIELRAAEARADEAHAKFRSTMAEIARSLGDLDRREAEAAKARAAVLGAALDLVDQASLAEDDLAAAFHDLGRAPSEPAPGNHPTLVDDTDDDRETQIFDGAPLSR